LPETFVRRYQSFEMRFLGIAAHDVLSYVKQLTGHLKLAIITGEVDDT
jgi:hypothetical protein